MSSSANNLGSSSMAKLEFFTRRAALSLSVVLGFFESMGGCVDSSGRESQGTGGSGTIEITSTGGSVADPVGNDPDCPGSTDTVHVCPDKVRAVMPPFALGMHTSVYDNNLVDAQLPGLLQEAGIAMLRYPGGGYADVYHWSQLKDLRLTPWGTTGKMGYQAANSDFGSFQTTASGAEAKFMITVDYGSSQSGTAGGQPQEAAAWVAYANGAPTDTTVIGADATGVDFKTVGYWASLRASAKLAVNDGLNFLRISRSDPIGVTYWEIGNEVFGNGYYDVTGKGYSQDLHAPYDPSLDFSARFHADALSPATYGTNVNAFAQAMKAVDPTIKIGAALVTPPIDYSWSTYNNVTWNDAVLSNCVSSIDFAIVHWYTGDVSNGVVNTASLLSKPTSTVNLIASNLNALFTKYVGHSIDWAVTELGPNNGTVPDPQARGLFAADAYTTLIEYGAFNVDHLELHDSVGSFLSSKSVRGPAFYGIRMLHLLASPADTLVAASRPTNQPLLVAHASSRADGSVGVMLLNMDPNNAATTSVLIDGKALASQGTRYDYTRTPDLVSSSATELGNQFTVTVNPYTIMTLVIAAQ